MLGYRMLITKERVEALKGKHSQLGLKLSYDAQKELFEYINQLELAEEGAKEAYGHLVEAKRGLEAECSRLNRLLQSAYDDIRRLNKKIDVS